MTTHVPEVLRQAISLEWLVAVVCISVIVNIVAAAKAIGLLRKWINRFDTYIAEHEILMHAKARSDGCSRQYLRDTAIAAATELARQASNGKARRASNGAAR